MVHTMIAEHLFILSNHCPDLSNLCKKWPITHKPKNQQVEIKTQAKVNMNFSYPANCKELVPMTPIVSIKAWGLNNETEAANIICNFAVRGCPPSCALCGLVNHVTKPI